MKITPQTKIVIVGHGDVMEASLRMHFAARGFVNVASVGSFNPLHAGVTQAFFEKERPEVVILGPVRSGGIGINQACPGEFIHDNMVSGANVIDTAWRTGVKKLLFLAPSCVYPKGCPSPIKEECFLSGAMEPTSLPYAMARAAGAVMCQAYRRQYDFNAIVAVPPTVYRADPSAGEDISAAHVLGAVLGKVERAVREKRPSVELWGTGAPRRELILGEDFASACAFLLENYDGQELVNIGAGEISVRDLAVLVAGELGFKGEIIWDVSRPDGAMTKLLDNTRLQSLGWQPSVSLKEGVRRTCEVLRGMK